MASVTCTSCKETCHFWLREDINVILLCCSCMSFLLFALATLHFFKKANPFHKEEFTQILNKKKPN